MWRWAGARPCPSLLSNTTSSSVGLEVYGLQKGEERSSFRRWADSTIDAHGLAYLNFYTLKLGADAKRHVVVPRPTQRTAESHIIGRDSLAYIRSLS